MDLFTGISFGGHWIWSLCILIIILILEKNILRPSFVLPRSMIYTIRKNIGRGILYLIYGCLILLPLDIHIPNGWLSQKDNLYIQIVLDTSLSMSSTDLGDSRFEIAKDILIEVLNEFDGLRVGLTIFSGVPVDVILSSDDLDAVVDRIDSLSIDQFPVNTEFLGTSIGDALLLSLDQAKNYDDASIILISDGSSSRGVDPLQIAYLAGEHQIPIHTLSIGSKQDIVLGYDREGEEVFAKYDIESLEKIAQLSDGIFAQVNNSSDIQKLIDRLYITISNHQDSRVSKNILAINKYIYQVLLICIVLILIKKLYILGQLCFIKR